MVTSGLDIKLLETLLHRLSHSTFATVGEAFFTRCVADIGQDLGIYGVSIGQFIHGQPPRIRLFALHLEEATQPPFFSSICEPPSTEVYQGNTLVFPTDVQRHYPKNPFFQSHGIVSYMGVPIFNSEQKILGELSLFDRRPMTQQMCNTLVYVLRTLSVRAGFEFERIGLKHNIQTTQDRLDFAVQGSSDGLWEAIVPINETWMSLNTEIWFSERFKQLLGYEDWEFENSVLFFFDHVHPEDRQGVIDAINRHLYEKIPYDVEYRLKLKNGSFHWFSARGRAIWDEDGNPLKFAGSLRDITPTRQAQQALRLSEERFRQFADNVKQVFWMTDPEKKEMLFINKAYETIWEQPCAQLYQDPRAFLTPVHADDKQRVMQYLRKQVNGPAALEYRLEMPNGTIKWIHDRSFPINDTDGKVFRVCGIAEDITLRKSLEKQLFLSEKMQAIGTLAGGLAHDFNNMLAGILGNNDLIRLLHPSQTQTLELVDAIERSAKRAADLTQQLLDFARSGKHENVPFHIHRCIHDATLLCNKSQEQNILLNLRAKKAIVQGDSSQVQQLIFNLLRNALDASDPNDVVIVQTKIVRLRNNTRFRNMLLQAGRYVCFSITDKGCGIPKQLQSRIFEPFFTTKDRTKGTGMGLSTAYAVAKSHGGIIVFDSTEGKGSTFSVYLPTATGPHVPMPCFPKKVTSLRGAGRILLIEDEELVRNTAKRILQTLGYRVQTAKNARQGIAIYRKKAGDFDLVIVDWIMPQIDGRECFKQLKKINPSIKALITTGLDPKAKQKEFLDLGFLGLIPKPFQIPSLSSTLAQALNGETTSKTI